MLKKESETVMAWIEAVNAGNLPALMALSDEGIEIVGPQGSAQGHEILKLWLERAGLRLKPGTRYGCGSQLLLLCEGVWLDALTGESRGQADLALAFELRDGKVLKCLRYDALKA